MEKRTLGSTGLDVTVLGYGAAELRGPRSWWGRPVSDEGAEQVLNAVLDAGINYIDTAQCYGLSESLIGKYASHRRDEFFLASKCGCTVDPKEDHDDFPHIWTKDSLMGNIESSLALLKTDYLDVWQPHNPSPEQLETDDWKEVVTTVKEQGKVRHMGISTTLPHIKTYLKWGMFDVFQIPYSALERKEENSIAEAARSGAGTVIRGGVAQGEPGSGTGKQEVWDCWEKARLDELREEGESRTAFLLRFTLTHPDVHTTIVGTMSTAHLAENVTALGAGPLADDVYAEAKRRLAAADQVPE